MFVQLDFIALGAFHVFDLVAITAYERVSKGFLASVPL